MIVLITFLCVLLLYCPAYSSWTNNCPVPVQYTKAKKIAHNDRGLRRLARIKDTTICLADGVDHLPQSEGIYRTKDNGENWELIGGIKGSCRGTIVAGPDETLFIFWIVAEGNASGIYFTKFRIDQKPSKPKAIYNGFVKSVGYQDGYQDMSAALDQEGNIYLVAHYPEKNGDFDGLWLLSSFDQGNTWSRPRQIVYQKGTSFAYPSLEVDHADNLILCFAQHSPVFMGGRKDDEKRIYFIKSPPKGNTWDKIIQVDNNSGPFRVYNPCIIEDKTNNLYIFAQRAFKGLVMAKSINGGNSWSGFSVIERTGNYADPSVAIGDDNTIYVVFRNDVICSNKAKYIWHTSITASKDMGKSWNIIYRYCDHGKVGAGLSFRYSNWWNYGGPLEWCWQQYLKEDNTIRPVYYNINHRLAIWNRKSAKD